MAKEGFHPLDLWSIAHFASGVFFALALVPWYGMLALAVGYEGFEAGLRQGHKHPKGGVFQPESWRNMTADVVVDMVGWAGGVWLVEAWLKPNGLLPWA